MENLGTTDTTLLLYELATQVVHLTHTASSTYMDHRSHTTTLCTCHTGCSSHPYSKSCIYGQQIPHYYCMYLQHRLFIPPIQQVLHIWTTYPTLLLYVLA